MKQIFYSIFFIIIIFSKAYSQKITIITDKFDPGTVSFQSDYEKFHPGGFLSEKYFYLSSVCKIKNKDEKYYLFFTYFGDNWLFINKVKLLIDDEIFVLKSPWDSQTEVISGGNVRERLQFPIEIKTVKKFSNAQKVVLRAIGRDYYLEDDLDESFREIFKKLLDKIKIYKGSHNSEINKTKPTKVDTVNSKSTDSAEGESNK